MQRVVWCVVALCGFVSVASAHETTDNRARLVLQEDNHLRGTLFLSYSTFLHNAIDRDERLADFLLNASAMPDGDFEQGLRRAHRLLEQETRITIGGRPATISGWLFPASSDARARIRQYMAAVLVGSHVHEDPLEVTFDVYWPGAIRDVRVRFPDALQTVTVVSYRPHQLDLARGTDSPVLAFDDAGAPRARLATFGRVAWSAAGLVVITLLVIFRGRPRRPKLAATPLLQ